MTSNAIDDTDTDSAAVFDPLIPTDRDKTPLRWDENPATIAGFLYEVGAHAKRTNTQQSFITNGIVVLKNGQAAIDHADAVQFFHPCTDAGGGGYGSLVAGNGRS